MNASIPARTNLNIFHIVFYVIIKINLELDKALGRHIMNLKEQFSPKFKPFWF